MSAVAAYEIVDASIDDNGRGAAEARKAMRRARVVKGVTVALCTAAVLLALTLAIVYTLRNLTRRPRNPQNDTPPSGWVWGCAEGNVSASLPFCSTSLPVAERVADLVSRLTPVERQSFLGADTAWTHVDGCSCMDHGVERLGIPPHLNLVEINTGVGSSCIEPGRCATSFHSSAGMAASFNRTLWRRVGDAISTEQRAFNNARWWRGIEQPWPKIGLIGLAAAVCASCAASAARHPFDSQSAVSAPVHMLLVGFGPNINIMRDPRFGRNSELPSECPLLTAEYAVEILRGLQEGMPEDDNTAAPKARNSEGQPFLKIAAGAKHFSLYSVDTNRFSFIPTVSAFDMADTYLPAFERALRKEGGNAQLTMCSYAGNNGVPSCANPDFLTGLLRVEWNRPDVVVASDCFAIKNLAHENHFAPDETHAAAMALNAGVDLGLGDMLFPPVAQGGTGALQAAINAGLTSTAHIEAALTRILTLRFRTGMFDPLEDNAALTSIPTSAINSTANQELNLDAVMQGVVLLRNDFIDAGDGNDTAAADASAAPSGERVLPFSPAASVALLGPHAFTRRDLIEGYGGDEFCYGGGESCIETIAEAFARLNAAESAAGRPAGVVSAAQGVELNSHSTSGISAALVLGAAADQIVLCLGLGKALEHEELDRVDIGLPVQQAAFAMQVLALGKPTVIILVNGGAVSIDEIAASSAADSAPIAIVEAFYPSQRGGEGLWRLLMGRSNAWGRMPYTIYPRAFQSEQSLTNFDMTAAPGRTYRYYNKQPLLAFGSGRSYSDFALDCELVDGAQEPRDGVTVQCDVSIASGPEGDAVLLLYHAVSPALREELTHPAPLRALKDFTRVSVPAPQSDASAPDSPTPKVRVSFVVPWSNLSLTNAAGRQTIYAGEHILTVSVGGDTPDVQLTVTIPPQQQQHAQAHQMHTPLAAIVRRMRDKDQQAPLQL